MKRLFQPLANRFCRSIFVAKTKAPLPYAFAAITILAIFVPFNPDMPDKGIDSAWIPAIKQARGDPREVWDRGLARLDQSWVFSLNAASARGLRFGTDLMFTFGPYASIYTRSFHPGTDRLMILGSLLLGLGYGIALLYLADGGKHKALIAVLLFCATFPSPDSLLVSYPFLLTACAVRIMESRTCVRRIDLEWSHLFAAGVALSALGLLPLIKGSLLAPVGLSLIVLGICISYRCVITQAVVLLLIPLVATATLWSVAHQSLSDLPSFLRGTIWLTSGYTEAMSTPWLSWPPIVGDGFVVIYLGISALIGWSLFFRYNRPSRLSRWSITVLCLAFLLVEFKHGFVRTDHVVIAFDSLALFVLIISFLYTDRYLLSALTITVLLVGAISIRQDPELIKEVRDSFGVGTATGKSRAGELARFVSKRALGTFARVTYKSTLNTYEQAWQGLRVRLKGNKALNDRFEHAKAHIRAEYVVPPLAGGTDVYTYEQSIILASDNDWNPRPVIQSYSAYTPELAKLNEEHLRGKRAPDWILFDLQPIDRRLPSLDDGISWPALLDNYRVSSFDGQFVTLHKNQSLVANSNLTVVYEQVESPGVAVTLPETEGPLYAEVKLKPTLLGRLLNMLFKPPQLEVALTMRSGKTERYRVIAKMMETGFVVSPLVRNTADFASLMAGDRRFENEAKVVSMSIAPLYGDSTFWASSYRLTIKAYKLPGVANSANDILSKAMFDHLQFHRSDEVATTHGLN